jgi:hypothetical protein
MLYRDQEIPGGELEVVVLASTTERSYFEADFDADKITAPDCFALAENQSDLAPHANVAAPVNDICKGCPLAEFGTARMGKGPACKTYRRLAVIPSSALRSPDMIAKAEIATCKVSPTSVKFWASYASQAVTSSGMPIWAQTTFMKNAPDNKTMQKQSFKDGIAITVEDALSALLAKLPEAEKLVAEPYTYEEAEVEKSGKY